MFRTLRRKLVRLAVVSGAGAAANYFFDRERGPERRTQAKEKAASLVGRPAANDWQSTAANGFEPQAATPPAAAPAFTSAATSAATSAPAPVVPPSTPSASVMDILDGSGGDSTVEPPPGTTPRTGPIPTS
ncbi:MAG: hypothetical protein ACR2KK_01520 [Acidimicrobiales bacterium]